MGLKQYHKIKISEYFGVICKSAVFIDTIWLNAREGCAMAVDILIFFLIQIWLLAREGGSGIDETFVQSPGGRDDSLLFSWRYIGGSVVLAFFNVHVCIRNTNVHWFQEPDFWSL